MALFSVYSSFWRLFRQDHKTEQTTKEQKTKEQTTKEQKTRKRIERRTESFSIICLDHLRFIFALILFSWLICFVFFRHSRVVIFYFNSFIDAANVHENLKKKRIEVYTLTVWKRFFLFFSFSFLNRITIRKTAFAIFTVISSILSLIAEATNGNLHI